MELISLGHKNQDLRKIRIFQRFVIFPQCAEKVVGRHDFVIPHMMAFVLLHLVMPDNFHFPSNSLAFPRKAKLKVTFHLAQLRN